ncbi:Protein of unknown function (DUF3223) [Plasmodiophora brassicae]|uniref:Uncharacterized protein n=1 Tax=Plasmodiophora brassicae TaxID=37360 RepID=A0A0G4ILW7_PLABS|nr:hypothetical protein PBRA_004777 [Plasmodiophora brassicae]SPQ93368.1 unnamed protein product [Plasmodiophora brassicae]
MRNCVVRSTMQPMLRLVMRQRGSFRRIGTRAPPPVDHADLHRRRRDELMRQGKMRLQEVREILGAYVPGEVLNPTHYSLITGLLSRHPLAGQILNGHAIPAAIRVVMHPAYQTPCFAAVLPDETENIFSYQLCLRGSTTNALFRIFAEACRQTLYDEGLITRVKTVVNTFAIANPGLQMTVLYGTVFQSFAMQSGLIFDKPDQLMRIVSRDNLVRWIIVDEKIKRDLIAYFSDLLCDPAPDIFKVSRASDPVPGAGTASSSAEHQQPPVHY